LFPSRQAQSHKFAAGHKCSSRGVISARLNVSLALLSADDRPRPKSHPISAFIGRNSSPTTLRLSPKFRTMRAVSTSRRRATQARQPLGRRGRYRRRRGDAG
jgi:hypothetical protein